MASCCPCFILASAGPYYMVLGAVMTQELIVQPLTPYMRVVDMANDQQHYTRIARTLMALVNGIKNLKQYWDGLPLPPDGKVPTSRFCPWPTSFKSAEGVDVHFEYIKPLEQRLATVVFLATRKDTDQLIVVKFTEVDGYGFEAHRLLAARNLAPQLLWYGKPRDISRLSMVVMEYIEGETLCSALERDCPPIGAKDQIQEALNILHEHGYVFGDLRCSNIMVTPKGDLKLIDFDWTGQDGVAKYPLRMSSGIDWAPGMGSMKVMKKEHDLAMLKKLFG